jgi:hypothetical protein
MGWYQPPRGHSRARLSRTAKPCGPGAPTLALSPGARNARFGMTGAKEPGPRGERGVSRQPTAQGKAGCFRLSLWFLPRAFLFAHGGRGYQSIPGLPCALSLFGGSYSLQSSGDTSRENTDPRPARGRRRIGLFDNEAERRRPGFDLGRAGEWPRRLDLRRTASRAGRSGRATTSLTHQSVRQAGGQK